MKKTSAVYQIKNMVTGERYVGSSKKVYKRWYNHKCPSKWDEHPNVGLYKAFQEYGLDNFMFAILAPVEPAYNDRRSNGRDVEKRKAYRQSDKGKAYQKAYNKSYANQLCNYNGETMTLNALRKRFSYYGIPHPTLEAKKIFDSITTKLTYYRGGKDEQSTKYTKPWYRNHKRQGLPRTRLSLGQTLTLMALT